MNRAQLRRRINRELRRSGNLSLWLVHTYHKANRALRRETLQMYCLRRE